MGLFLLVAAIPFVLFSALGQSGSGGHAYRSGYRSGPSFYFLDFDGPRRGRGYSSGSFQSGGFRSGK